MRHWSVGILLAGTRKVDQPCTEVWSPAVLVTGGNSERQPEVRLFVILSIPPC